jgi:hydroxyacylglutathione hydrolase
MLIVAEDLDQVDEAVTRLARVGIESVNGFLGGGMYAWDKSGLEVATAPQMSIDELRSRIEEKSDLQIIDVRRPGEYESGHAPGAISVPLGSLESRAEGLDSTRPTAVICASGYRSSIAVSLLERRGFRALFNIVGGTSAWINAGYPVES